METRGFMYRYELHAHTCECDKVATISGGQLVEEYHKAGYDGLVITDHYFSLFFDWFANELTNKTKDQIITRWLKGYYAAKERGKELQFTVLPGAEVRLKGSANDYLIYGLEEKDFYGLPYLHQLPTLEDVKKVLPSYALLVQAHPFRDRMLVHSPDCLFGIEGYNGSNPPIRNDLAKLFARHYQKPITSGSDCHHLNAVGKGGIVTPTPILCPADLSAVLQKGKYEVIEP